MPQPDREGAAGVRGISSRALEAEPLLAVRDLDVRYAIRRGAFSGAAELRAVAGVSFELRAGETLGIVGESGSGKSTLVRAILRLIRPSGGRVSWLGQSMAELPASQLRALRGEMQVVFQDPLASLDPRMTILETVAEPLVIFRRKLSRADRKREVLAMLEQVGLGGAVADRYPHEFSGGQCQRIAIARALILKPRLLVCDEPVSALDVSIQAQIVNLLTKLQREMNLSLLFISHNLAVVRHVSQRVLVLYLGRVMELAPREELYTRPRHPYTHVLLESIPVTDPAREQARRRSGSIGEIPSPLSPPTGCVFRTRCPWAQPRCAAEVPPLESVSLNHQVACVRWRELEP
jgi:oligopeptide transport system ATP-binding protein